MLRGYDKNRTCMMHHVSDPNKVNSNIPNYGPYQSAATILVLVVPTVRPLSGSWRYGSRME